MPILCLGSHWAAPGSGFPLGIPGFGVPIGVAPGTGVPLGIPGYGVPIGPLQVKASGTLGPLGPPKGSWPFGTPLGHPPRPPGLGFPLGGTWVLFLYLFSIICTQDLQGTLAGFFILLLFLF